MGATASVEFDTGIGDTGIPEPERGFGSTGIPVSVQAQRRFFGWLDAALPPARSEFLVSRVAGDESAIPAAFVKL